MPPRLPCASSRRGASSGSADAAAPAARLIFSRFRRVKVPMQVLPTGPRRLAKSTGDRAGLAWGVAMATAALPRRQAGSFGAPIEGASGLENSVAARVALRAVLVVHYPLGRGVYAEKAEHLVPDHAEAVGDLRRDGDRVALAQGHPAVLAAVDPRLGDAVQDVKDLHVGMRVDGRDVAGLGGLDARADRGRPLVVAENQLVDRVRPELHDLGLVEANDLQLVHGSLRGVSCRSLAQVGSKAQAMPS